MSPFDKPITHEEITALFGQQWPVGASEIMIDSMTNPRAARQKLYDMLKRNRERMPPMACTGCGSMESVEEIKVRSPGALSCCPERKMVPAADLIKELQKRPLESTVSWYGERAADLKRYNGDKNYVAMEAVMTELILDGGKRAANS